MSALVILFAIVAGGTAGILGLSRIMDARETKKHVQQVARELGLEYVARGVVRGEVKGHMVRITTEFWSVYLAVKKEAFPVNISVWYFPGQNRAGGGFEVGDKAFDSTFSCQGSLRSEAYLNHSARQALLYLARGGNFIIDVSSDLVCLKTTVAVTAGQLRQAISHAMTFIDEFLRPGTLKDILADNLARDPEPMVRLNNLNILLDFFPGDPEIQPILKKAVRDEDHIVRLLAAAHLEGDCSRQMGEILAKGNMDHAQNAILLLLRMGTPEARRELRRALEACIFPISVIGALVRLKDIPAVDTIMSAIKKRDLNEEETRVAYQALADLGPEQAKPMLLDALGSTDRELVIIAARALGRCGNVEDVERLHQAMLESKSKRVRRALEQAIAEIQSRLGSADAGWLALADHEHHVGALSEDEKARGGEVSPTHGPPSDNSKSSD